MVSWHLRPNLKELQLKAPNLIELYIEGNPILNDSRFGISFLGFGAT